MVLLPLFLNIRENFLCALHRTLSQCGHSNNDTWPLSLQEGNKGPDTNNLPEVGTACIKFQTVLFDTGMHATSLGKVRGELCVSV